MLFINEQNIAAAVILSLLPFNLCATVHSDFHIITAVDQGPHQQWEGDSHKVGARAQVQVGPGKLRSKNICISLGSPPISFL